jgi:predicted NAD/FAD-dependent oxidoreductase
MVHILTDKGTEVSEREFLLEASCSWSRHLYTSEDAEVVQVTNSKPAPEG